MPRSVMSLLGFLCLSVVSYSVMDLVEGQSDGGVAVRWGIADSTATVGKLFRLHIPSDAFQGEVVSYTLQSYDGSSLPRWLHFDAKDNILQGIPTPADAGQVFLELTAHGKSSQASITSTLFVRDVATHTSGAPLRFKASGPEFVWCKQTESETVATIIIDADLEALPVLDRLNLLNKFLSYMDLHEGMVKILPVGSSPLHDSSALVSGTGDGASPKTSGLFLSWPVGCGQVKESHFPVLQKLDDDSSNGKIAKSVGYPVIGWQVTNSRFQAPTRRRRQVHVTATPAATPVMPTKTQSKQEMTDDKMTHKLIETQSPTFIQPTATQTVEMKTDEPIVVVMPTEATPVVAPVTRTQDIKPTKSDGSMKSTDVPTGTGADACVRGQKPEVKKQFDQFTYKPGEIINIVIPDDTFADCEVNGTRGLQLNLYTDTEATIPSDFFLQFDSKSRKIIGLPLNENVGIFRFNLTGKKASNKMSASTAIVINITEAKVQEQNHELSITIKYNYDTFKASVFDQVNLANRVAGVYGDSNTSNLIITKIKQGSVVCVWYNASIGSSSGCPADEINALAGRLINKDGSLNDKALEQMKPFELLSAQAEPTGACKGSEKFLPVTGKRSEHTTTTDGDGAKGSESRDDKDDVWVSTVVPVVVVIVIILIAVLIACILYRRTRKGKMNVEEQNTFINRGTPVIFPDELEEKPSDANKPLLVEGGPSPPPEYHRGTSESPEPQVSGNYGNPSASTPADDSITEIREQPYEPPPPLTAPNNGKQPRPAHQQQPFSQAPQILP